MCISVCGVEEHIDFRAILLTGLNRFTLSHCGSRTPLPTLKPHLAATAPRLCTGCSLDFTGAGLSPAYISSAELAHPLIRDFTTNLIKGAPAPYVQRSAIRRIFLSRKTPMDQFDDPVLVLRGHLVIRGQAESTGKDIFISGTD